MQIDLFDDVVHTKHDKFSIGDMVYEANSWHNTQAEIIEILEFNSDYFFRVKFNNENGGTVKTLLPEFRISKCQNIF